MTTVIEKQIAGPSFCMMQPSLLDSLANKYNKPVPRYTSYPTVPYWYEPFSLADWLPALQQQFEASNQSHGISLYVHLPFCESLCTYCGCNKKITTNHRVEQVYLETLLKEWRMYLELLGARPHIREMHFGGGTPTFFSPVNLRKLVDSIFEQAVRHPQFEFSIEGHPNNTTTPHLETLHSLGFRRISYGVQDNDPEVQHIINRIQPLEKVRRATEEARSVGFLSVNYDLVYGLPRQSMQGLRQTVQDVIALRPDRIAFYSYAHVPWTSRGQRLFDENDLPSASEKLALYLEGRKLLTDAGYTDIGMDHYALPGDALHEAWLAKTLHRNFMGYTTQQTKLLLGLGVSSISDAGFAFAQNHKNLTDYYRSVESYQLPVSKGYCLTSEDMLFRRYILDVCCKGEVRFSDDHRETLEAYTFPELSMLESDGLVRWDATGTILTEQGRNFIRNVARAFDLHLLRSTQAHSAPRFSNAV
jgi:oxygen-independent coproporphyrinogen-3 oxidase